MRRSGIGVALAACLWSCAQPTPNPRPAPEPGAVEESATASGPEEPEDSSAAPSQSEGQGEDRQSPKQPGALAGSTPLDRLRTQLGYRDTSEWMAVDITDSSVSESPRRVYFRTAAVVDALLRYEVPTPGGNAPIPYPTGTSFVVENRSESGTVLATEVLTVGTDEPQFQRFDASGQPVLDAESAQFELTSASCVDCHTGTGYFDPMMSYPSEPTAQRLAIPEEWRDLKLVLHFLEAFHRGGAVFGPYASILLGRWKAEAAANELPSENRAAYESLRQRFPELLPALDEDRAESTRGS